MIGYGTCDDEEVRYEVKVIGLSSQEQRKDIKRERRDMLHGYLRELISKTVEMHGIKICVVQL